MSSPDLHDRLTEAACRSFTADAEAKLSARDFISRVARTDDPAAVENAIARWHHADAAKRRFGWKSVLALLAVLLSLAIGIKDFKDIRRTLKWRFGGGILHMGVVDMQAPAFFSSLTPSQRLLFAGVGESSPITTAKELWLTEPDNPAYFSEYAAAYIAEESSLPPDFLETAARIDPDNAWFPYMAPSVIALDAFKPDPRRSRKVGTRQVYDHAKTWTFTDRARFDSALQFIRQARPLGKCDNYTSEMLAKRAPLLRYDDLAGWMEAYLALNTSGSGGTLRLRKVADVLSASAWSLGQAGDTAGFKELSVDADHFLHFLCGTPPGPVIDGMAFHLYAQFVSESFAYAAEKLALPEEASRWRGIFERIDEMQQGRSTREWRVDGKPLPENATPGGALGESVKYFAKQARDQPLLTDADLKPGRMLEHDIFSRYCGYLLALLLAPITGLVALYRFRIKRLPRALATKSQALLAPLDWAWILGAGVLLPFIHVFAINLLTPLGGHFAGTEGTGMSLPFGHFVGLLILWLIVPPVVARWRLAKSARVLGFLPPSAWSWLAIACALALIPAVGWMAASAPSREVFIGLLEKLDGPEYYWEDLSLPSGAASLDAIPFWITLILFLASLAWIVVSLGIAFFTPSIRQLRCAAVSMAMLPVFSFAIILTALSSLAFKSGERHWIAREKLTSPSSALDGWEHRVAVQMRKELRETLGYSGEPVK